MQFNYKVFISIVKVKRILKTKFNVTKKSHISPDVEFEYDHFQ